jgi:hypothetical protein
MIEINTYARLNKVLKEFKKGSFDFLIVVGDAGLGKTFNTRKILGKNVMYVNSHTTILALYQDGYEKRDIPIWFDDVEGLFDKDKMIGLLKQFCETSPIKFIQYNTSWNLEECRNVPKSYETKSKILMTSNSLTRLGNKGIQSLLDRAILIYFKPSKEEMLNYIKKNFNEMFDKELFDKLFKCNETFSLRDYIKSYQLKKAGFNII